MRVVGNMDDFLKTLHIIQKTVDPLQPVIEQTQKIVAPLQPILEQAQQIQQLNAVVEPALSVADRIGVTQIAELAQQGAFDSLVSRNNELSYILKIQAQTYEIFQLQRGILGNNSIAAINVYVQSIYFPILLHLVANR